MKEIVFAANFEGWREAARQALARGETPAEIVWHEGGDALESLRLFETNGGTAGESVVAVRTARVPAAFIQIARRVACHRSLSKWALLYRLLWRLATEQPQLLEIVVDPDVRALTSMDKAVRRDLHKMRAFVRFREVADERGSVFVAWFEPRHLITEMNASFFVDRFASQRWSILTPDRCAHWDGGQLHLSPGVTRGHARGEDAIEDLWITYYSHIFNPARLKLNAMGAEMPKFYWKNLPEASAIPGLVQKAGRRMEVMMEESNQAARPVEIGGAVMVPESGNFEQLRVAAQACRGCPLYAKATQTVFGEGPADAKIVLLGEQPGDQEDEVGRPFVGPAGKLLDRALRDAGVDRAKCYVTNAVKHFKWEPRGKRRLHQKPNLDELKACRPWWKAELSLLKPDVLVCLGGTAARAVFDRSVKVLSERGEIRETEYAPRTLVTVHPSSLLRLPDQESREREYAHFVRDLRLIDRSPQA